ncbi:retinol dehydrogenase 13-like [Eriocheir sinensis]|uniref:retinol dehydrogenase 13-like n=1 Tax=Eriocheir sinensis TaxID=95602 RepID=UPI0021C74F02|nr:retinol dehydrogenase 13-like [Eriocheir sinensis]
MMLWVGVVVGVAVVVGVVRLVYRGVGGRCSSSRRLDGRTVIVTGASAGIGKAAALDFAQRGARVIMACRNLEKAGKVADEIVKASGNSSVEVRLLDTSDLGSVRNFAQGVLKSEEYLHVLVNNAGIAGNYSRATTKDGLEITMATNYYGHFLLTNLLLGLLKKSAPSRIINVSSIMHKFNSKLDPEDLNFEKMSYHRLSSYNQSKLCQILFTLELTEKLKGTNVTANSLHPGAVATEINLKARSFTTYVAHILFKLMGKDCALGAQTLIYLAVAEEVEGVSGKYFVDCKEEACSELARHRGMAKKLWEASELDVKLQEEETHY